MTVDPGTPRLTVELVGLPGSGKSRLAGALEQGIAAHGIAVDQPRAQLSSVPTARRWAGKALACGGVAVRAPGTSLRLARAMARSGQPGPGDVAGRLVQVLLGLSLLARAERTPGVTILDEGLLQAVWSTGLRGNADPVMAALDSRPGLAWPDLLVVLRVAPEVAAARLAARSSRNSRTQLLEDGERLAELQRGEELLDRVVGWFSRSSAGRSEVVTVHGREEDGDDRARLIGTIRDRLA